ncbi:hypothetical protein BCR42DRAFT_420794 [Absidia repens]|uniref:Uncharacterized protein n=1 Tax=Absidia repens TaxID=90262 RepID=A0A1X2I8U9_9FUNG|nr:hypothetical protein BCR42DRAFT_420794 [Absidia repens]
MESDYSDDDDYLPISVGAWGDQSQQQQQSSTGHGQVDDTSSPQDPTKTDTNGWAQMIDPHAKKLAGALGSGGLHRQGKNYKPIDEEYIINQRKGVVIPKSKKDTKARAPRFNSKQSAPLPPSASKGFDRTCKKSSTAVSNFSKPRKTTPTPQPPPPPPSTIRRPLPPTSSGQSGWGAQPLVETPFWEKKDNNTSPSQTQPTKITPPPPPSQSRSSKNKSHNNNKWSTSWDRNSANTTPKTPTSGFDSHQPIETISTASTISPPPGFGPAPQRQYPVKTNKPQLRPPPGFSYTDKSAWGTSTPPPQPDSKSQLHSWGNSNESKDLWKRMDESTGATGKKSPTNKSNGSGVNKNLDWVSGWDDVSMNQTPPSTKTTTSSPSHDGTGGWGAAPSLNNNNNNNGGTWGISPSDNDKWASASQMADNNMAGQSNNDDTATPESPMQFIDRQMAGFHSGRFSDPRKNKYSSTTMADQQQEQQQQQSKRLPQNYYQRNGTSRPAFMEAPLRVAMPPPSHNPVVISIHLELDTGNKIPIAIRKLDNPEALARQFCQSQNIDNPALINGIIGLFTQQKATAMQRYNK